MSRSTSFACRARLPSNKGLKLTVRLAALAAADFWLYRGSTRASAAKAPARSLSPIRYPDKRFLDGLNIGLRVE